MIKAATQTLKSRIASDPVKVMALTDGGTHSDKKKAEDINKFGLGAMEASEANELLPECFVDEMIFGTSFLWVYADNSEDGEWRICSEKVFPPEMLVDEAETLVGPAYQLYRKRVMSRSRLEALYPKKKATIRLAQAEVVNIGQKATVDDMVVVLEGWHRRSDYKAKDGKHMLAVTSGELTSDDFEENKFPFAIGRWTKQTIGFYGEGFVAQVQSIQAAITKELYIIDQCLEVCGMPYVLTEDQSEVIFEHFSNGIGAQIQYTGTQPQIIAPSPVAPEHFQFLTANQKMFYDMSRMSEMSATGEVQSNIKSGAGIRTQQAVESVGWKDTQKSYQRLYIDALKLHLDVARQIAEKNPGYSVKTKDGKFMRSMKVKDIDLRDGIYTWHLWPTSLLPDEPEGKFDRANELVQAGWITPEQALFISDFPDTKSVTQYNQAAIKWTEWAIDKIQDEGKQVAMLPFAGYQKVIDTVQAAYLVAQMENLPPARLAMLQTFWQQAIDGQAKVNAAAAAQAQGAAALAPQPGATPQAKPMQAPVSSQLPQVAPNA